MNLIFAQKHENQQRPIKLYRNPKSGHCHKVELMLALLDLPYECIDVDMGNGHHKQTEFLALNPLGQVPVIDDNDTVLGDSNAILVYLVKRYDSENKWYPQDPTTAAHIQRWLSVSAGEVAFGPAAARLVKVFGATLDHDRAVTIAHGLLATMEKYLAGRETLVGDTHTLADIACFSYIAHAPEGAVSLTEYANVRRWLDGVRALDGFVPMLASEDLTV